MDGVFSNLVDECAYLDKIVVGLWGKRRQALGPDVTKIDDVPIGGGNRIYARKTRGTSRCGNTAGWNYGVFKMVPWRKKIPPIQMTIKSDQTPITNGELRAVESSVLCARYKELVSAVEFTFDISARKINGFSEIERQLFTSARHFDRRKDFQNKETLYVGSSRSPWQLRVYQKNSDIIRFEFIFRAVFLRSFGIADSHELIRLRSVDLSALARWPDQRVLSIVEHLIRNEHGWKLRASLLQLRHWPQDVDRQLQQYGLCTRDLFPPSALDDTIKRMQRRFIW